jgi:signal transduction histidine kinase/PAS domain-containing protein
MIAEVLNGQNYQASWYALPTFLTASVLLAMGFMVRGREQRSRVSTSFCMMTATGAIWLCSYSLMYCALSETVAIFWSQVGQIGVNLIPPAVFSFAASSLQADAKLRRRIWLVRQLAIGFTLTLLLPDGFLAGVRLHGWGYYPVYDWLGTVFVGFFMLVMAVSLNMYRTGYRNALPGPVRSRNQGLFTALSIAAFGSVDYLAALGVPLYPFGYLPVLGSVLLANRTIRRYRLVTITPEFAAKEIIDAMDDALLVLDSSGIVRVSNKAALRMFSRPAVSLNGTDVRALAKLLAPNDAELSQRMLKGSLREYQCTLNGGPDRSMLLSVSSFTMGEHDEGDPVAAVCMVRDVTQRRLAEQQIQRHADRQAALYELNLAASSTLDLDAVLNVLLDRLAQTVPAGAMTVELFRGADRRFASIASRGIDDQGWKTRAQKLDGAPHPVVRAKATVVISDMSVTADGLDNNFFLDAGFKYYLGIPLIAMDDVIGVLSFYAKQPRHYGGEELTFLRSLASHAAMAIHNSELYEQTILQTRELAKANQIKEDFLSVMSHELRTPLNVITGYTKLIQEGLMGAVTAEQSKALGKVTHHADELLFMVNSIMHATKIEAGIVEAEKRQFWLNSFLDDLKALYDYPHGKEIGLRWQFPNDLPPIDSDQEKLKHILQNLINNAIKFTDTGIVTVFAQPRPERNAVEFGVSDTGIGISANELPHVFDRFRQADSSKTRTYGGVGLGLHIVKTFTELLGGEVSASSKPNMGSTFTVLIPCNGKLRDPVPA